MAVSSIFLRGFAELFTHLPHPPPGITALTQKHPHSFLSNMSMLLKNKSYMVRQEWEEGTYATAGARNLISSSLSPCPLHRR